MDLFPRGGNVTMNSEPDVSQRSEAAMKLSKTRGGFMAYARSRLRHATPPPPPPPPPSQNRPSSPHCITPPTAIHRLRCIPSVRHNRSHSIDSPPG
ncbi:unnamed protein product, partial [Iphiclides podalirius]